jgi:PAS domain S-box-containing protein
MNPLGFSEPTPERLADILEQHHQKIYEHWLAAMQQKWPGPAERKLSFLKQKIADRQDLFSILRECSGKTEAYYQHIAPFLNLDCITSQEYSILDVFEEVVELRDTILHLLSQLGISPEEREQLNSLVHGQMYALVKGFLCGAKELLDNLVNGGMRGYCQVDERGGIVCADQKCQELLHRKPNPGEPLDHFFIKNERDLFTSFFSGRSTTPPGPQQLHLDSHPQDPTPVGVELSPMFLDGQQRGWYACLVDLSAIQEKERQVFDKLLVGLAQIDSKGKFRYANRKFLEILGIENQGWQGKDLWEFLPDKENREKLWREIKKRRDDKESEYEVSFTRKNGYQVPVKIYGVPERDLKNEIIGSLAIVRSLEREKVMAAMTRHMATIRPWPQMLTKVAQELAPLIPFDFFSVSEVSTDGKHIRRLHSYSPNGEEIRWETRWLHVPDKLVNWFKEQNDIVIIGNLEKYLSPPEWEEIRNLADVQQLIQEFRSCLRYPIVRDRVVASVNFFRRQKDFYLPKHRDLLEALPLDKVVLMALDIVQEEENQFHFDLIRQISSDCQNLLQVIRILVDRLAEKYQCNVALFQADEELGRFRLLYQKGTKHRFPKNYQQPFEEGILGYVYQKKEDVNAGDVQEDPKFKDIVKLVWQQTHSEICLLIPTPEDCWLLNIEDDRKYLLSPEEFEGLKDFRDKIIQFLERTWLYHSLKVVQQKTSDAIIRTDQQGVIKEVNPAAARLLGYTSKTLKGHSMARFFQDPDVAEQAMKSLVFLDQKVTWQNKNGASVRVLLSAFPLPKPFEGRIFTAKDLKYEVQQEKLQYMGKLHQEIANQIKTPLSLIFAWLNRLEANIPEDEADTLDKVFKQLHKVELTCDRLSLCDDDRAGWVPYHEVLLDGSEIVEKVLTLLPESEREKIDVEYHEPLSPLRGDLFQLTFCLETILSYLFRVIPEDARIRLRAFQKDDRLNLEVAGSFPDPQEIGDYRTWAAMALGEEAIRAIMANHRGTYSDPERQGEKMVFRFAIPVAEGESP